MARTFLYLLVLSIGSASCYYYDNVTYTPDVIQLLEYKRRHPVPLQWTESSGSPVDVRDPITLNSDLFSSDLFFDLQSHMDGERIPERRVFAKGTGAFGYFEVTNDISKYTKADVFNGIGKKTPIVTRFSVTGQRLGGSDVSLTNKGFSVKFYTNEGNLDLVNINIPVFTFRDPFYFISFSRAHDRNPKTNLIDYTQFWDYIINRPNTLHGALWISSDFGLPNGYTKMDGFPIHTFVLVNNKGEKYYVKFNFRTEQGLESLTLADARAMAAVDPDFYMRDLYNRLENKQYPTWKLEMDVMTEDDLKKVKFDPFDVTRVWPEDSYKTVEVGRLVLKHAPENWFRDIEQLAFSPSNLVPGIPGPVDLIFRARRFAYRQAHIHRLGVNHNKIETNKPKYAKNYNRDGTPPVKHNMGDAPVPYPNSFNGPIPWVDENKPKERLYVYQKNDVDLEQPAWFYNKILKTEGQKQRLAENLAGTLVRVTQPTQGKALELLSLTDPDLGKRVRIALQRVSLVVASTNATTPVQCMSVTDVAARLLLAKHAQHLKL